MPIYEYQCKSCGYIDEAIVSVANSDVPCSESCPLCRGNNRSRLISLPAEHIAAKKFFSAFPYLSHMTQDVVIGKDKNGKPITKKERVYMESKEQQDEFMKRNGYVYWEEKESEGMLGKASKIPDYLRKYLDHPVRRKYLDDRKKGRIPDHMFLTEEEFNTKFQGAENAG